MLVTLPIELRAALTYFVTQGIKAFLNLFGKDMSGWTSAITAAVVGAVLVFIDGVLASIPAEFADSVGAFLTFLVAVLSAFGLHFSVKSVSA
ncbi:MAG: hypothetical protein ACXABY_00975 [Candidatus Thorarchaeota archaeon]|jgi:uncharacterized Tic20 family protein